MYFGPEIGPSVIRYSQMKGNCEITSGVSFLLDLIPVIPTNSVDPDTIFANNEMSLRDIEIYGFDYDYTLAFYSRHLHTLIFNIARDLLITNHRVRVQHFKHILSLCCRVRHLNPQTFPLEMLKYWLYLVVTYLKVVFMTE